MALGASGVNRGPALTLTVKVRAAGKGFPAPDGYIAAIAAASRFTVASRDASAFHAAGLTVIDPWTATR